MCYLFKFSRFILVPILLEWLETENVVSLDSALCNRLVRERFVEVIIEYKSKFRLSLFPNNQPLSLSEELMEWSSQRQLGTFESIALNKRFMQQLQFNSPSKISHVFSRLSFNGFLNTKIKEDRTVKMTDRNSYFSSIKHMDLSHFSESNNDALFELLKCCDNLESVTISNAESNEVLKTFKKSCVRLKQLTIQHSNVKEKTVMALCRQSPDLTALTLLKSLELSSSSWHQLTVNNRSLTTLRVGKVTSNRSLQQWALHHSGSSSLVELVLHQASDVSVRCLIWSSLTSLLRIDLSFSPLNDFTLSEVGAACPSLVEVRLKNCHSLTTAGVHALCKQVPRLQLLDLRNVDKLTNEGVASIVLQCRELHTLLLYSQENVTKVGLRYLGAYASPHLTHLSLCNMHLTDETLAYIVHHCPHLSEVELGINGRVTDQAFSVLAAVCGAGLRRLDLTCCDRLTELTLFALAEHCSGLTDLNVSICNLVSDEGVSRVVRCCRALRVLVLYHCKCVSDVSMEAVALYGGRLTLLNIGHTAVTLTSTLEKIIRSCNRLRELKVTHSNQDKLLNYAAKVSPNLHVQFMQ